MRRPDEAGRSRTAEHYVGPATRNTLMRPGELVNVEVINTPCCMPAIHCSHQFGSEGHGAACRHATMHKSLRGKDPWLAEEEYE